VVRVYRQTHTSQIHISYKRRLVNCWPVGGGSMHAVILTKGFNGQTAVFIQSPILKRPKSKSVMKGGELCSVLDPNC